MFILDGYNVIKSVPEFRRSLDGGLEAGRQVLGAFCSEWILKRRDVDEFCIVFDGDSSVAMSDVRPGPRVGTLYTATGESADDRIVRLLHNHANPAALTVVTADRELAARAAGVGAAVLDPLSFYRRGRPSDSRGRSGSAGPHPSPPAEPGHKGLSVAEEKRITEELMREWEVE
jgi:predicted RNA-binding protein with PIN domain